MDIRCDEIKEIAQVFQEACLDELKRLVPVVIVVQEIQDEASKRRLPVCN